MLKLKYGRSNIIAQSHIIALYKMQNRKVTSDPASMTRLFVDVTTHI